MNDILKVILKLSISGSIFFMIFFLISFFTKRIFSAKWHLFILKLNMIFFIFPVVSICDYFSRNSRKVYSNSFNIVFNEIGNKNDYLVFFNCFFIIWILGVSLFIIWNIYCYHKFIKEVMSQSYEDISFDNMLYKCKLKLNITSEVAIRKSNRINSPMVVGILNPKIIFPSNIEYDNKLEPVITHELVHLKRKDLLTKFIQIGITAVNWFNPIIYMMNNSMEKWCEISCDEIVAENMSYEERKEYGKTVLSIIENVSLTSNNLCLYLCNDKKYIKRRLIMMLKVKKSTKTKKIFAGMLLAGIVLGATGISVSATAETSNPEAINLVGKTYEEAVSMIKDAGLEFISKDSTPTDIIGNPSRGAIVAVDIETGEVLSSVSFGE
ncbi:M56 family metallopeptidase [Clostridioides difficile]